MDAFRPRPCGPRETVGVACDPGGRRDCREEDGVPPLQLPGCDHRLPTAPVQVLGAKMQVSSVNEGPMTLLLEV